MYAIRSYYGARQQVAAPLAVGNGERREIVLGVHHADVGGAARNNFV